MKNKKKQSEGLTRKKRLSIKEVIMESDDFCIINEEKIEGNACSTVLNNN
ncbi:hypothetical protein NBE98_08870 [Clostridium swellfunianum]|nr:hypothetical protein [Clostridium swellfunianum]MCM0648486.1 hypothetical protein [Clostridium swellfunianum]